MSDTLFCFSEDVKIDEIFEERRRMEVGIGPSHGEDASHGSLETVHRRDVGRHLQQRLALHR